jgi:hypothetical protein
MDQFIKHFIRESDGSWMCVALALWPGPPVIAVTPRARFTPGTVIAGCEPAKLLEDQYEKQGKKI